MYFGITKSIKNAYKERCRLKSSSENLSFRETNINIDISSQSTSFINESNAEN